MMQINGYNSVHLRKDTTAEAAHENEPRLAVLLVTVGGFVINTKPENRTKYK